MSVTITWAPNLEADIDSYELQRAPDVSGVPGTFTALIVVLHDLAGTNYDSVTGRFFYEDTTGGPTHWYQIRSKDTDGNYSPYSASFQISAATAPAPFTNVVELNADFGGANTLQYVDAGANPIEGAQLRIYKKVDYDQGNLGAVVAVTTTTSTGVWTDSVFVEPGFTYTIQFFKPGAFGPDTQEVVVP